MSNLYTATPKPLRKRTHDVFLSHAHVDKDAIIRLRNWLGSAGLNVWYDAEQVPGGALFPSAIASGICDSQSMIVAVSKGSLESGWVEQELTQGTVHSQEYKPFPVIPLRLENCVLPAPLIAHSAIDGFDAFGGHLSGLEASRLLASIHGLPDATPPIAARDDIIQTIAAMSGEEAAPLGRARCPSLFMTFGWRDAENERKLRDAVCKALDGFCLIGDAVDHAHSDPFRVAAIMEGCIGQIIVIPKRGSGNWDDHDYKGIRSEVQTGLEAGLPQHFIIEKGITNLRIDNVASQIEVDLQEGTSAWTNTLDQWADGLVRTKHTGRPSHYVFVATDFDDLVMKDHVVRHISKVTGLPCLKGGDFLGKTPSRKIEIAIRGASLVVANLVSKNLPDGRPEVNWNTCIEAGMAIGAGKPVHLIARRATGDTWTIRDNLPFMVRENNISTYADDTELIALVHRICRPFRRRVLNTSGKI